MIFCGSLFGVHVINKHLFHWLALPGFCRMEKRGFSFDWNVGIFYCVDWSHLGQKLVLSEMGQHLLLIAKLVGTARGYFMLCVYLINSGKEA